MKIRIKFELNKYMPFDNLQDADKFELRENLQLKLILVKKKSSKYPSQEVRKKHNK